MSNIIRFFNGQDDEEVAKLAKAFKKEEWREVAQMLRPDIDDAAFEKWWVEFVEDRRQRKIHLVTRRISR